MKKTDQGSALRELLSSRAVTSTTPTQAEPVDHMFPRRVNCKLLSLHQWHQINNRALCSVLAVKHAFQEKKRALLLCPFTPPILQMEKQAQDPEATASEPHDESEV